MNIKKNNNLREEFVKIWAKKLKENSTIREEQIALIDNQIVNAREFYDRLIKTRGGYEKIVKIFNIRNKKILKRLKEESEDNVVDLVVKESKEFVKI